jgi:hypothetical protein
MSKGAKFMLGGTVVLLLAVAIRVGLIYKANHEDGPVIKKAAEAPPMSDDDAVMYNLRKLRPDSLKDVRDLTGKTIWVSAGGQMDYYHDTGNHVDYAHPVGILLGAVPMLVKGVFEQVAPKSGRAVARIGPGERHVLVAFTLPKSDTPTALYATPVGYYDAGHYTLYDDQLFFYDDPHELYKHWGEEMWSHIDKHEAVLGMSENQAMMALGEVIDPRGDKPGDRTVYFDNNTHPVAIEFVNGKAARITPEN